MIYTEKDDNYRLLATLQAGKKNFRIPLPVKVHLYESIRFCQTIRFILLFWVSTGPRKQKKKLNESLPVWGPWNFCALSLNIIYSDVFIVTMCTLCMEKPCAHLQFQYWFLQLSSWLFLSNVQYWYQAEHHRVLEGSGTDPECQTLISGLMISKSEFRQVNSVSSIFRLHCLLEDYLVTIITNNFGECHLANLCQLSFSKSEKYRAFSLATIKATFSVNVGGPKQNINSETGVAIAKWSWHQAGGRRFIRSILDSSSCQPFVIKWLPHPFIIFLI